MRINENEIRNADIFEILLDSFPDMIHSIDDDGNIVYTNKKDEKLIGYSREELLTMNIRQLYADEILEEVERGFSDLKERGDKTVDDSLLKAKDGTLISVEIRSFSIYDDDGKFLRTFSILRDTRPIKELQASLIHAGRLAAIGELASGVAHDINNPLTIVILANELIQRELERTDIDSNDVRERVAMHSRNIAKATTSIQKISDHLRNFSRGMVERKEMVDLADSLNDALFITDNKIKKCHVSVEQDVAESGYFVKGCVNHIEQVLVNLIGNACDAMLSGDERRLRIGVVEELREGTPYWRIDVSDTGPGIPSELREEVFRSFFTTKEKGKGTGLGLSISRGIVKDHKGELELTCEEGGGSTFSVLLPQMQPEG